MPKVSVIMPSYNHGRFIEKAIDSILCQSWDDFELLIADDMSKDNSREVINRYKDKRIITFFFDENKGASETTNFLIEQAKGEYVAMANSDDYWHLDKLKKQLNFLENNPDYGACFTNAIFVNEEGEQLKNRTFTGVEYMQAEWVKKFFREGNCLCHSSVMIRKEVYNEVGMYSWTYRQLPDFDMWIRILKRYNIYVLEEDLTYYRWEIKNKSNTSYPTIENLAQFYFESIRILSEFFDDMDKQLFTDAFHGSFIRKSEYIDIYDMKCEQYFILLNGDSYLKETGKRAAINYFEKIYKDKNVRLAFEKKYNYRIKDFHRLVLETEKNFLFRTILIDKIKKYKARLVNKLKIRK